MFKTLPCVSVNCICFTAQLVSKQTTQIHNKVTIQIHRHLYTDTGTQLVSAAYADTQQGDNTDTHIHRYRYSWWAAYVDTQQGDNDQHFDHQYSQEWKITSAQLCELCMLTITTIWNKSLGRCGAQELSVVKMHVQLYCALLALCSSGIELF